VLADAPCIEAAFVYGSTGRGNARPGGDLDSSLGTASGPLSLPAIRVSMKTCATC
jgi:hypothetical protein